MEYSIFMTIFSRTIGIVFAYAAVAKFQDINQFVDGIRSYQLVGARIALPVALLLIGTEGAVALSHLMLFALPISVPFTIFLLGFFLAVTINSVRRGEGRKCLCFGAKQNDNLDGSSIARSALMLTVEAALLIAMLLGIYPREYSDPATFFISLVAALAAAALASWSLSLPALFLWWSLRPTGKIGKTTSSRLSGDPLWLSDPVPNDL